jgi:NADH:ubiquinone oxidoreductase subunit F (NADH-binding)/NADH:ubiquinone oxidoreductase subunit E
VRELERRYGRPGTDVIPELRTQAATRGRIEAAEVERVAADVALPRAHVNGSASFYADLAPTPRGTRHVRICDGTACFAACGESQVEAVADALGAPVGGVSADGSTSTQPVYCLGSCYASPAALDGETLRAGGDLVAQLTGGAVATEPEIPVGIETPEPVVLAGIAGADPEAWTVWGEVLAEGGAARVAREVSASGLRGRGGAGFPAAVKWGSAAEAPSDGPKYVVCNGDEGDPGSFVDRLLMERDPHRILEGMALAALVVGARQGFAYVRSEYPGARDALERAVVEARAAGHLGGDVHGSGVDFDVEVFEGAGSYVAGEETALINSLEGLRGEVRARPPFPAQRGFLHRPTVVNNVETLSSVPWIVARGGAAYAALGAADSRGTKVVCLNERFARPGAYEVELGIPLRDIVEGIGGGLRDGATLRALQVGGPLGGFLSPDMLDVALTFEALRPAGVDLGHAGLIAIDERVEPRRLLQHVWEFAAAESCGTCAPCRIGTRRGLEAASAFARGTAPFPAAHGALLETMEHGSLCAFGRAVPPVIRSLARVYPELAEAAG